MRCRTCLETIQNELYRALDEVHSEKNPKTLADIILEVAKIDTKSNFNLGFENVCSFCIVKIDSAYDFVLQVQAANERFLQFDLNEHNLFFDEVPMDISETELEIKPHESYFDISDPCELIDQNESKEENEYENIKVEIDRPEPVLKTTDHDIRPELYESTNNKKDNKSDDESPERKDFIEEINNSEEHSISDFNNKKNNAKTSDHQIQLRPRRSRQQKKSIRSVKKKTLTRKPKVTKSQLQIQENEISNASENSVADSGDEWKPDDEFELSNCDQICSINKNRRPNTNDINYIKKLYDKQDFKLIQCKLCDLEFKRIIELRKHLKQHKDEMKISDNTECYAIVNENGYELCISEADDDDIEQSRLFKCILCNETFKSIHKILIHGLQDHNGDIPPFKCPVCKFNFVNEKICNQHVQHQCRNKLKKFKCSYCHGRFRSEENCIAHNCPNSTSSKNRTEKYVKLECDYCGKDFIWIKDLKRHRLVHTQKIGDFKCKYCDKAFLRKENLKCHLNSRHKMEKDLKTELEKLTIFKKVKIQAVNEYLQIPHGRKTIECMLCQSQQLRMSELKEHLLNHQTETSYADNWNKIEDISKLLYPDFYKALNKKEIVKRITKELSAYKFDRFYSIVDDAGYEMNLDSSETETETENEFEDVVKKTKVKNSKEYKCEICNMTFERKYKAFKHQSLTHDWNEAKHICLSCGARFINAKLLKWHKKRQCKNPLKRFQCRKCPLSFIWKQNRTNHMRTHQRNIILEEYGTCTKCNFVFKSKYQYELHLKESSCRENGTSKDNIFHCFYCTRFFYTFSSLSSHLLRHDILPANYHLAETLIKATNNLNGFKNIHCRVCNLNFPTIKSLRIHLLNESKTLFSKHFELESPLNYTITNSLGFEMDIEDSETDENDDDDEDDNTLYQCTLCETTVKRKFQMSLHNLSFHQYEKLPLKCDRCIFRTVSQNILDHHKRSQCYNIVKKFECDICNFKFMWPESLNTHKLHHSEMQNLKIDQKYFECNDCGCKFNKENTLQKHIQSKHNSDNACKTEIEKKEVKKTFLCTICGTAFLTKQGLNKHILTHTNEKPYACNLCDKSYRSIDSLKKHRFTHTGEKPYTCKICPEQKTFRSRSGLKLHILSHTGERPYNCPFCEKNFTSSSGLLIHKRRHTGEKPFVCEVCGARFIKSELLKKHRSLQEHNQVIST